MWQTLTFPLRAFGRMLAALFPPAAIATAVWLVTGFSSLTFVITAAVCVIWASVALYIWRAQLDGAVRRMHRGLTKRGERW
ncbi:hypothetical protein [Amycolatopsis sp. NBC_01286]|uniref:hypothetical protein n=1 Tax=Amycolatopsis sp. NBC_01286 TaxID=2903560 RepID=UPI002E16448A|nr:hypothetical protein OG570_48125 [Amycolatopsis sp. NBC_01286]